MKKLFFTIFIMALLLTGCGEQEQMMDLPAEDGNYYYKNKDLGFSIILPSEFKYYQTQRKETDGYIDIEFFVPTADTEYQQEVPGYGKPIVVRIFNNDEWDEILEAKDDGLLYKVVGKESNKVWTIKFWEKVPVDWQKKWSEEMKSKIINGFRVR